MSALEVSDPSLWSGLGFALNLGGRIMLLGWIWRHLLPLNSSDSPSWKTVALNLNRVVLCGFSLNLLLVLALSLGGIYTAGPDWIGLGVLALIGAVLFRSRPPDNLRLHLNGFVGLLLLLFGVYFLPQPSQWLAGGWDPGVYLNEAVSLERDGHFYPADTVFQKDLSASDQSLFLRQFVNRTERFPGILVDFQRNTIRFELHRVTPAALAMVMRSGGPHAAFQANRLLGLLCVLSLTALLLQYSDPRHALLAGLFLLTNPVWLYHIHIPVSEILQLFLVLGMGHLFCAADRGRGPTLFLGGLLALAIMNRFSFLPFAGLFLCAMAYRDLNSDARRSVVYTHLILVLCCTAAVLMNFLFAWDSILGWNKKYLIFQVAGLAAAMEWILISLGRTQRLRTALTLRPVWLTGPLTAAACILGITLWYLGRRHPAADDLDNVYKAVMYLGWPVCVAALAGGLLTVFSPKPRWSVSLTCFLLFLLGISVLMLADKSIIDLYPWALRRYVPYLLPLVCLLAPLPAISCLEAEALPSRLRISLALAAILLPLGLTLPASIDAATHIEYGGFAEALQDVADQIAPTDVVVADSPKWGTPLHLAFGKTILNGKRLWETEQPHTVEQGLQVLKGLHHKGYRVRFLTTTEKALDWYAAPIAPATLNWTSPEYTYPVMIHHRKITSVNTQSEVRTIRLYTWTPPQAAASGGDGIIQRLPDAP